MVTSFPDDPLPPPPEKPPDEPPPELQELPELPDEKVNPPIEALPFAQLLFGPGYCLLQQVLVVFRENRFHVTNL